jgi:hypothetical protein
MLDYYIDETMRHAWQAGVLDRELHPKIARLRELFVGYCSVKVQPTKTTTAESSGSSRTTAKPKHVCQRQEIAHIADTNEVQIEKEISIQDVVTDKFKVAEESTGNIIDLS